MTRYWNSPRTPYRGPKPGAGSYKIEILLLTYFKAFIDTPANTLGGTSQRVLFPRGSRQHVPRLLDPTPYLAPGVLQGWLLGFAFISRVFMGALRSGGQCDQQLRPEPRGPEHFVDGSPLPE